MGPKKDTPKKTIAPPPTKVVEEELLPPPPVLKRSNTTDIQTQYAGDCFAHASARCATKLLRKIYYPKLLQYIAEHGIVVEEEPEPEEEKQKKEVKKTQYTNSFAAFGDSDSDEEEEEEKETSTARLKEEKSKAKEQALYDAIGFTQDAYDQIRSIIVSRFGCDGAHSSSAMIYLLDRRIQRRAELFSIRSIRNNSLLPPSIKEYNPFDEYTIVAGYIPCHWNFTQFPPNMIVHTLHDNTQLYCEFSYKNNGEFSPIQKECKKDVGNHAVTITSMTRKEDGSYAYIFKNSWGNEWNEAGTFTITSQNYHNFMCKKRGYNTSKVSFALFYMFKKDMPIEIIQDTDENEETIYTGQLYIHPDTGVKIYHGKGEFIEKKGNDEIFYEGMFEHGFFHGQGKLSNMKYIEQGNFYYGRIHGDECSIIFKDDTKTEFIGRCDHGDFKQGQVNYHDPETNEIVLSYHGQFVDNMLNGEATQIVKNPDEMYTYTGHFDRDEKNGQGKIQYEMTSAKNPGCMYEGEWKNNKMHGLGIFTFQDGSQYHGAFINDVIRSSKGVMKFVNGDQFIGDFSNLFKVGNNYVGLPKGTYVVANDDQTVYTGQFYGILDKQPIHTSSNSKILYKNNHVTYSGPFYRNSDTAQGSPPFLKGSINPNVHVSLKSEGSIVFRNHGNIDMFEGYFRSDQVEGQGTYTTDYDEYDTETPKDVYEGIFTGTFDVTCSGQNNVTVSEGVITYKNGDVYRGPFIMAPSCADRPPFLRHGQGTMIFHDPSKAEQTGEWKEDVFVALGGALTPFRIENAQRQRCLSLIFNEKRRNKNRNYTRKRKNRKTNKKRKIQRKKTRTKQTILPRRFLKQK